MLWIPNKESCHISSTRSFSSPPHRPAVLPGVHATIWSLRTHPTRGRTADDEIRTQLGLAPPLPSISPTPVGPQSKSSRQHVLSRLVTSARPGCGDPVRYLSAGPLPATLCRYSTARTLVVFLLLGMGRAALHGTGGYKRIYLVGMGDS